VRNFEATITVLFLLILFLVLAALKLTGVISSSWWLITEPVWFWPASVLWAFLFVAVWSIARAKA